MESGQTIAGKYRLNQLLGTGGMASVWSATNIFTDRQFAMKFMLPSVARTAEAKKRFLMEAKVSARVDHPNIIEVIDVGQTEEGTLFLVMELLTGVPLEVAMERQSPPMSLHEFAVVMVQVARALVAAHRSGVVHRDLKPTNVFLHEGRDRQPVVKLLDFGVSKFIEDEPTSLTIAGTIFGSPLYMSPEQARGDADIDERTDVYSFGAICFEALCGYRAHDAQNFNALLVKIATTAPKSIDEAAPHVPEVLRTVVRECMVSDRKKREVRVDEIARRLFAALPELEESGLHLPSPRALGGGGDPDATNALPVIRPHDRPLPPSEPPPSLAGVSSSSDRASRPSSSHHEVESRRSRPSDADGRADRRSEPHGHATRRGKDRPGSSGREQERPARWFFGGALASGLVLLTVVGIRQSRTDGAPVEPAASVANRPSPPASTPPAAPPPLLPSLPSAASSEPPVVSIDALPMASAGGRAPHAVAPDGGRLREP